MRKTPFRIAIGCSFLAVAAFVFAQAHKPGLWETTATTTWQQSPMPAGMQMPAGANNPFAGGTHTSQACVTQAMIDKYGSAPPDLRGDCQMANVVKKSDGMTADIVCSGRMSGKGAVEASWSDNSSATGKVHFIGSMQAGPSGGRPIEWTTSFTSAFKSSDCGSVKPAAMPDK